MKKDEANNGEDLVVKCGYVAPMTVDVSDENIAGNYQLIFFNKTHYKRLHGEYEKSLNGLDVINEILYNKMATGVFRFTDFNELLGFLINKKKITKEDAVLYRLET